MNHSRITIIISSFAIAIFGGTFLSTPAVQAAETSYTLINTAVAKEATPRQDQDKAPEVLSTAQRIAILKEVITSSQDEIATLTGKLKDLQLDEQWGLARDHFINTLATSSDHYSKLSDQISQKDLPLEAVKSIAKDLKDWREATYAPELKEVGNLILIFQTESVRSIVEARDVKISNDLKKLDRQKLVNTETLKKYLAQAEKSIKNAQDLNNEAKGLYFKTSVAPLQPKEDIKASSNDLTPQVSPSEKATEEDQTTPTKEPVDVQDTIRDLSKDSLKELKVAYELFFKMNDRIRK